VEAQLGAQRAGPLRQHAQQRAARDADEAVPARRHHRAVHVDRDVVPAREVARECLVGRGVGRVQRRQRLLGEHDAPAVRVVGRVALEHGHAVRGIGLTQQRREVEPGRTTADDHDVQQGLRGVGPAVAPGRRTAAVILAAGPGAGKAAIARGAPVCVRGPRGEDAGAYAPRPRSPPSGPLPACVPVSAPPCSPSCSSPAPARAGGRAGGGAGGGREVRDAALEAQLAALAREVDGDVGSTCATSAPAAPRHPADETYPTASMVKVPILVGLFDAFRAGSSTRSGRSSSATRSCYPGATCRRSCATRRACRCRRSRCT
jgi:hypothetical protein